MWYLDGLNRFGVMFLYHLSSASPTVSPTIHHLSSITFTTFCKSEIYGKLDICSDSSPLFLAGVHLTWDVLTPYLSHIRRESHIIPMARRRYGEVTSGSGKSHQGKRITMAQPVSSILGDVVKSSRSIAQQVNSRWAAGEQQQASSAPLKEWSNIFFFKSTQ